MLQSKKTLVASLIALLVSSSIGLTQGLQNRRHGFENTPDRIHQRIIGHMAFGEIGLRREARIGLAQNRVTISGDDFALA